MADEVIVATSNLSEDDAIAEACTEWELTVFRGPAKDLTTRLLAAAKAANLDAFVRVTADNPLTDPGGIAELIRTFLANQPKHQNHLTLVHNMHKGGYPYGTGAECLNRALLEFCDQYLESEDERENFAQFAKQHPEQFECIRMDAPPHLVRPQYFLTVDYPEDLVLQRKIYEYFSGRDDMGLGEIVECLDANPDLMKLNSHLHSQFPE